MFPPLAATATRSSGGRCTNSTSTAFAPIRRRQKGASSGAHLTMQDRLVKELRLEGISSIEAANAFMPTYVTAYKAMFAKVPRETYDAHRPVREDEDLDLIFTW